MAHSLQAVREAAIDGRMQNVTLRQLQLESLYKTLFEHVGAIQQAISNDSGHSDDEVAIEYLLAMNTLKEYYQSLDLNKALKEEYNISRGEDRETRREPVGIVYIVPTSYTLFYSVVVAVGAALAAGNCVVIEFQNTLQNVPALLRKLFKSALDHSTIEFTSTRASDEDLGANHIRVFQEEAAVSLVPPTTNPAIPPPLSSPSEARVIAIVDRTADLTRAAEALVAARFAFAGHSPYAPDAVFVNEFVKKPFLVALMKAAMNLTVNLSPIDVEKSKRSIGKNQQVNSLIQDAAEKDGIDIVSSIGRGTILEVTDRNSKLLKSKISGPNLVIHNIRSLDDAIDLANSNQTLLASYLFSDAESGKYLSQFINARVSFVNQIPVEILVGPPAPDNTSTHRSIRYPIELFTVPRPQYITPSPLSQTLHEALRTGAAAAAPIKRLLLSEVSTAAASVSSTAAKRSAEGRIQIGFFEQGILTGLALFSLPILVSVGTLGYFGVNALLKYRSHV